MRHLVQEVRAADVPTFAYYYDLGMHCKDARSPVRGARQWPCNARGDLVTLVRRCCG